MKPLTLGVETPHDNNRTIVRLKTKTFKRGNEYFYAKVLTTLKRKSKGHDLLNDEICEEIDLLSLIDNLQQVDDGVYELDYINMTEDWETGFCEPNGYILRKVELEE